MVLLLSPRALLTTSLLPCTSFFPFPYWVWTPWSSSILQLEKLLVIHNNYQEGEPEDCGPALQSRGRESWTPLLPGLCTLDGRSLFLNLPCGETDLCFLAREMLLNTALTVQQLVKFFFAATKGLTDWRGRKGRGRGVSKKMLALTAGVSWPQAGGQILS